MILTVVGSGTAIPDRERGSPCCHLSTQNCSVVFDLGSGSVRQLWRFGIDVRSIDLLALSHFHPDHTADLVPLLFALRNPEFGCQERLVLAGPVGLVDYFSALEGLYGDWIRPPRLRLDLREVTEREDFGSLRLSVARTGHTTESIAFRVDDGERAVVYGGDSPESEGLVRLAEGADLLVLECSFPEGAPAEGHMTPGQAAAVAEKAGARCLLLTHFYPAAAASDLMTPARRRYGGDILLARDGMKVEVAAGGGHTVWRESRAERERGSLPDTAGKAR
jgi:ribonuclease BN (tRNA processing enzyme)